MHRAICGYSHVIHGNSLYLHVRTLIGIKRCGGGGGGGRVACTNEIWEPHQSVQIHRSFKFNL